LAGNIADFLNSLANSRTNWRGIGRRQANVPGAGPAGEGLGWADGNSVLVEDLDLEGFALLNANFQGERPVARQGAKHVRDLRIAGIANSHEGPGGGSLDGVADNGFCGSTAFEIGNRGIQIDSARGPAATAQKKNQKPHAEKTLDHGPKRIK